MKMIGVWLIAAAALAQPTAPETIALPEPLARVLSDYETAWQKKDARGLASLFTEDGFVLAGGHPPVHGRAAIETHYRAKGGPLSLRAFAYATEGPVGYILGGYAERKGDPDVGKFTLTLRREGGRWMIVSDMDNGNRRPAPTNAGAAGPVVFVCEHGTVKSVMAAHLFNRLAAARNAPFRAISRGVAPDAAIPAAVATSLQADGFDVASFRPEALTATDVAGAARVIAIGVDSPLLAGTQRVTRWDDIPPASKDYAAASEAMRARMGALLDELSRRP